MQFSKTSPLKSGESSEKSSGENRVKSCHVCGYHGFSGGRTVPTKRVVQGKCPLHFLNLNGVVCSNTLFSNTSALTSSLLFWGNSTCKILEHLVCSNTSGFQFWGPLARTNFLSALCGLPSFFGPELRGFFDCNLLSPGLSAPRSQRYGLRMSEDFSRASTRKICPNKSHERATKKPRKKPRKTPKHCFSKQMRATKKPRKSHEKVTSKNVTSNEKSSENANANSDAPRGVDSEF